MRDSAVFPRVERPTSEGPREETALDAAPSLDLWQTIYDAAANEGSILHDDTVSAIDSAIRAALARSAPAEKLEEAKDDDDHARGHKWGSSIADLPRRNDGEK